MYSFRKDNRPQTLTSCKDGRFYIGKTLGELNGLHLFAILKRRFFNRSDTIGNGYRLKLTVRECHSTNLGYSFQELKRAKATVTKCTTGDGFESFRQNDSNQVWTVRKNISLQSYDGICLVLVDDRLWDYNRSFVWFIEAVFLTVNPSNRFLFDSTRCSQLVGDTIHQNINLSTRYIWYK